MENVTKPCYLIGFSHICQPRNRRFLCKLDVSKRGPRREPPKLLTHCFQELAIRAPGEPRAGKGSQPSPQRDSKRVPKGIQNRFFQKSRHTGDPQGFPRAFQGPPGSQKWTKILPKSQKSVVAAPLQPALETAVKKIVIAVPLQPATETAVKKFVLAASLQPATETAVKKIVEAASLQPC